MAETIHLLGAGRANGSLAPILTRAGYRLGFVLTRDPSSAERATRQWGCGTATTDLRDVFADHDITLIGVPDRTLADEASRWAPHVAPGSITLHLSGALSSDVLAPLRERGALTGSFHPSYSFASRDTTLDSLDGACCAVEGMPGAVKAALRLVEAVYGTPLTLTAETKPLHHAAACVASNALVALLDLTVQLESTCGLSPALGFRAMRPLIESTLRNVERLGIPQALTGPIERGDVDVVQRHLRAMESFDGKEFYRTLSLATLDVARRKGTISDASFDAVRRLLESGDAERDA